MCCLYCSALAVAPLEARYTQPLVLAALRCPQGSRTWHHCVLLIYLPWALHCVLRQHQELLHGCEQLMSSRSQHGGASCSSEAGVLFLDL